MAALQATSTSVGFAPQDRDPKFHRIDTTTIPSRNLDRESKLLTYVPADKTVRRLSTLLQDVVEPGGTNYSRPAVSKVTHDDRNRRTHASARTNLGSAGARRAQNGTSKTGHQHGSKSLSTLEPTLALQDGTYSRSRLQPSRSWPLKSRSFDTSEAKGSHDARISLYFVDDIESCSHDDADRRACPSQVDLSPRINSVPKQSSTHLFTTSRYSNMPESSGVLDMGVNNQARCQPPHRRHKQSRSLGTGPRGSSGSQPRHATTSTHPSSLTKASALSDNLQDRESSHSNSHGVLESNVHSGHEPLRLTARAECPPNARDCEYTIFPPLPRGRPTTFNTTIGPYTSNDRSYTGTWVIQEPVSTNPNPFIRGFRGLRSRGRSHVKATGKCLKVHAPFNRPGLSTPACPGYPVASTFPSTRVADVGRKEKGTAWHKISKKCVSMLNKKSSPTDCNNHDLNPAVTVKLKAAASTVLVSIHSKLRALRRKKRTSTHVTPQTRISDTDWPARTGYGTVVRPNTIPSMSRNTSCDIGPPFTRQSHRGGITPKKELSLGYSGLKITCDSRPRDSPDVRTYPVGFFGKRMAGISKDEQDGALAQPRKRPRSELLIDPNAIRATFSTDNFGVVCLTEVSDPEPTSPSGQDSETGSLFSLPTSDEGLLSNDAGTFSEATWNLASPSWRMFRRRNPRLRTFQPSVGRTMSSDFIPIQPSRLTSYSSRGEKKEFVAIDIDSKQMEAENIHDKMDRMYGMPKGVRAGRYGGVNSSFLSRSAIQRKQARTDRSRVRGRFRIPQHQKFPETMSSLLRTDSGQLFVLAGPTLLSQAEYVNDHKSRNYSSRSTSSIATGSSFRPSATTIKKSLMKKQRDNSRIGLLHCEVVSSSSPTAGYLTTGPSQTSRSTKKRARTVAMKPKPRYYSSMPLYVRYTQSRTTNNRQVDDTTASDIL